MALFENSFINHQDMEIFYHSWIIDEPIGDIILSHGLGEHSECYTEFAERLNKSLWNVHALDHQGHGRSEGKRGYVQNFQDFINDLTQFSQFIHQSRSTSPRPLVLFGHSMGGLIAIKTVVQNPALFNGLCLSDPAVGLKMEVHPIKIKFAHFGAQWLPRVTLWNEIRDEDLTRDEGHLKTYSKDPLRHDRISPQLFLGMQEGFTQKEELAQQIKVPVLLLVAAQDKIISPQAQMDFFKAITQAKKELHIYEESYHEIFNDLEKKLAYKDLINFLNTLR